jgi:hypothetical protein
VSEGEYILVRIGGSSENKTMTATAGRKPEINPYSAGFQPLTVDNHEKPEKLVNIHLLAPSSLLIPILVLNSNLSCATNFQGWQLPAQTQPENPRK